MVNVAVIGTGYIGPIHIEALRRVSGVHVKGVTDATAARIAHTLVDGLTKGDNPREIGRALAKEVNVGKVRAQTIARTEATA